ncbi:MAG TPA: HD domain-containing phosphohydrolase [Anaeromyxobacter sp.]|nr:HD domain-containing phosphohydrolase [Anaeromyxobacter sp.]
MFDRIKLPEDLVDCRGTVLAPRGTVISPESIEEAADRAPHLARTSLAQTPLVEDARLALEAPVYGPLFSRDGAREKVERTLRAVLLPEPLVDELLAMRSELPGLYRHGLYTAAVGVRVLLTAVGTGRALSDLAAAALLHDLGMRQLPARILAHHDRLSVEQLQRIASHPLVGAYHLATVFGHHPAVTAARCHHWRCGQGYPGLGRPPARAIEVLSVASAFCALTQPRPYRSGAYDARGAVDVLVGETVIGRADANTVKLLVHALRGGVGDPRGVRFGTSRLGHGPLQNGHSPVEAPPRSPV